MVGVGKESKSTKRPASATKAAAAEETAVSSTATRGLRKKRDGIVVSNKMSKTVVVAVVSQVKHPGYGKYVRKTARYYAHDEGSVCGVGDRVRIVETRPLSKMKRWKVESILAKAE
jgi:small subunit ribosomal protein S17